MRVINATKKHAITLYVPALVSRWGEAAAWPPRLHAIISRARSMPLAASGWGGRTLSLFGLPEDTGLAATARLGEGLEPDAGWWVRCDPVHLAVHGDRLVLTDNDQLALDLDQAWALSEAVTSVFSEEGGAVQVCAPNRWYLTLPAPEPLLALPLAQIIGRNIHDYLPSGNGPYWRVRLTEMQMLLHQRLAGAHGGEGPAGSVNSVWFWGAGFAPSPGERIFDTVYTDDVLVRGAAHGAGSQTLPLPLKSEDIHIEGSVLLAWPRTHGLAEPEDAAPRKQVLEALMAEWIAPLIDRLRRKECEELILLGDQGPVFHWGRGDLWRFWRSWREWK